MALQIERGAIDLTAPRHPDVEDIEIDLLLEAIFRRYGYDFRQYARGSIRRRIWKRMMDEGTGTISGLQQRILRDKGAMDRLLVDLSVNVTAMFRDPTFYLALRRTVVPLLRTYPFIRIWNAGCATGEETYSLAILLQEEDLYERSRIYATDMNEGVLDRAAEGRFPLDKMKRYTNNYLAAGGRQEFSRYYITDADQARFSDVLARNIVFAHHNLVSDGPFNEFHLVLCRNVMIYFDRNLQDRVLALFDQSLSTFGVLALGRKESLAFSRWKDAYQELDPGEKIYKKVV